MANIRKYQHGGFDTEAMFKEYKNVNNEATLVPYLPVDEDEEERPLEIEPWMLREDIWKDVQKTPSSSQTEYKDYTGQTFKTMDASGKQKTLGFLAGLIKPGLAVGSAALNLQHLQKSREAAKGITSPRVDAATMPVRPIQTLSPEIVAQYMKNIGSMKVKKTSDAISNRIAEQMLNLSKMAAMDKLSTKQAETLTHERTRHDKATALNVAEAVRARNEAAKYAADVANKRAMIDAQYYGKKQDFINRWIEEAIVKPMEKRIAYNVGKEAVEKSEAWNRLQTQIVNAQNMYQLSPTKANKDNLNKLLMQQQEMGDQTLPNYGATARYLIPRKSS